MLTKDLLKHSTRRGKVYPYFVKPDDARMEDIASRMISFFSSGENTKRGEIEETVATYIRGCPRQFEAKGFKKLLFDRSDFSHPEEIDYEENRAAILARASIYHKDHTFDSPELLRQVVYGGEPKRALYADLPDNERLVKFRAVYPKQLLHRYNLAQVQGLLFTASAITIRTADPKAANLRRMFKFLRFFRLLSRIYREENGSLRLQIDGPLSILESSRKYGLQLASFFPAVCLLDHWELNADVTAKKKDCKLELNHESGLVSHYRNFSAYVPDEVAMFASQFKKDADGWTINPKTPFINLGDGEVIFPDFTFEDENGEQVYLELFHRWHRGNLLPRLRMCIAKGERPLILGIDLSLMTDELKELLNSGLLAEHRYFTFRDYPSVRKVMKCLKEFGDS